MTTVVPINRANRYAHIDAMRAFAVLIVVVAHAGLGHIVPGGSGVTIFFAISGFIISYLVLRERDATDGFSIRGFYVRRLVKLAPPFVLLLFIPSLVYAVWVPIDWGAVASQVFFTFNWVYMNGGANVMPGTNVVWSLAIEEQFYIVFALLWFFIVRSRGWRSGLLVASGIAIVASNVLRVVLLEVGADEHRIYYGTDTRLDGIALGVVTAVLYHWWQLSGSKSNVWVRALASDWMLVAAILLYVFTLIFRDESFRYTARFPLQAVAACLVIMYGMLPGDTKVKTLFYAACTWRPVAMIGLSSYSIYLAHLTVAHLIEPATSILPKTAEVVVVTVVGVAVGVVCYVLVEQRVAALYKRMSTRKQAG
jgi:peptidoglycan/LPS O-acetylase OafA/YrhL